MKCLSNGIDALASKSEGRQAKRFLFLCPFVWASTRLRGTFPPQRVSSRKSHTGLACPAAWVLVDSKYSIVDRPRLASSKNGQSFFSEMTYSVQQNCYVWWVSMERAHCRGHQSSTGHRDSEDIISALRRAVLRLKPGLKSGPLWAWSTWWVVCSVILGKKAEASEDRSIGPWELCCLQGFLAAVWTTQKWTVPVS